MTVPARILIVDDEPQIRKFLRIGLGANGFEVIEASSGKEGVDLCAAAQPEAVVLDLGLGDIDGIEVIARIREWSGVPIIVLSVRASEEEKVRALDAGADDYVVKPFSPAELMARIRAALRRRAKDEGAEPVYENAGLRIDLAKRSVALNGEPVRLSRKEYSILALLARYAGRVVTQTQILEEVWGKVHREDTQYLRVYIGQLREKLGDDASKPKYLETEAGVGYRLRI